MIEIKNLKKRFGNQLVFGGLSTSFPDKGLILLLGESGSGKTTFLNILAGQISFDEGYVTWRGEKYEHSLPNTLDGKAEYITQDPFFVDFLNVADKLHLLQQTEEQAGQSALLDQGI